MPNTGLDSVVRKTPYGPYGGKGHPRLRLRAGIFCGKNNRERGSDISGYSGEDTPPDICLDYGEEEGGLLFPARRKNKTRLRVNKVHGVATEEVRFQGKQGR